MVKIKPKKNPARSGPVKRERTVNQIAHFSQKPVAPHIDLRHSGQKKCPARLTVVTVEIGCARG